MSLLKFPSAFPSTPPTHPLLRPRPSITITMFSFISFIVALFFTMLASNASPVPSTNGTAHELDKRVDHWGRVSKSHSTAHSMLLITIHREHTTTRLVMPVTVVSGTRTAVLSSPFPLLATGITMEATATRLATAASIPTCTNRVMNSGLRSSTRRITNALMARHGTAAQAVGLKILVCGNSGVRQSMRTHRSGQTCLPPCSNNLVASTRVYSTSNGTS